MRACKHLNTLNKMKEQEEGILSIDAVAIECDRGEVPDRLGHIKTSEQYIGTTSI